MTCRDCHNPAPMLLMPYGLREQIRDAVRPIPIPVSFDTAMHILADQRCPECFWWRLALLIGYCIF